MVALTLCQPSLLHPLPNMHLISSRISFYSQQRVKVISVVTVKIINFIMFDTYAKHNNIDAVPKVYNLFLQVQNLGICLKASLLIFVYLFSFTFDRKPQANVSPNWELNS